MLQKTHWIIIVTFTAVIFFAMGFIFSYLGNRTPISGNSFQAGWDAAKKRLSDSGASPSSGMNIEVKSLTGEISEISGDKITLKIRPLEPLADASLDTRIIVVDSATKIYSLEPKDQKEFTAEMDAYNKKMRAGVAQTISTTSATSTTPVTPILPPEGFKRTVISISDLKVGQMINVSSDKNIKEVKEFNATEISYYKPTTQIVPIVPVINPIIPVNPTAATTAPVKK